jgi:hypothetical protein
LWTDQSEFINNGIINKQNNRYLDNHSPHWVIKINNPCVWGTNVCRGLIEGKLSGSYYYNGTLHRRRYLEFLMNELPIMLDDIPFATRNNSILQQDGAPAHNVTVVRNYLNENFENRWIKNLWDNTMATLIPKSHITRLLFVGISKNCRLCRPTN